MRVGVMPPLCLSTTYYKWRWMRKLLPCIDCTSYLPVVRSFGAGSGSGRTTNRDAPPVPLHNVLQMVLEALAAPVY